MGLRLQDEKMEANRWRKIEEIMKEALSLPDAVRSDYLQELCGQDRTLLDEVKEYIKLHDDSDSFLEHPVLDWLLKSQPEGVIQRLSGKIRHFTIIDLIGSGGMGAVYLARQERPIKRLVALKALNHKLPTAEARARFRWEYQALAQMEHEGIAKVYEAGVTEDNHPFFTMEYFRGSSITEFCGERRLNLKQRIHLFVQVCEAVQHAHQMGVIHRDLKPSNILVGRRGDKSIVKIIDFGLAKAVGALQPEAFHTGRAVLGTLGYLSPEQADPLNRPIDIRTDIYALGAVFYQMLTGQLPFWAPDGEVNLPFQALIAKLKNESPEPPSAKLTNEPGAAVRRIDADLDWVVLKALAPDPDQRYRTVDELEADLWRYLRRQPVLAGPPSRWRRALKFVQRHKVAVSLLLFVVSTLTVAVAVSVQSLWRERTAREEAVLEARKFATLFDFFIDVLSAPNPYVQDRNINLADALVGIGKRIEADLHGEPALRIPLHRALGKTFQGLGILDQALPHFGLALNLAEDVYDRDHPIVLQSHFDLAQCYLLSGDLEESRDQLAVIEKRARAADLPGDLRQRAETLAAHLLRKEGRPSEAIHRYRELIDRLEPGGPVYLDVLRGLGNALYDLGKYTQAERVFEETARLQKAFYGIDGHFEVVNTLNNLANAYTEQGEFALAAEILQRIWSSKTEKLGKDHFSTMVTAHNLGYNLFRAGQYERSAEVLVDALRGFEAIDHSHAFSAANNLGRAYLALERFAEAEAHFRTWRARILATPDFNQLQAIFMGNNLAKALLGQEKWGQAAEVLTAVEAEIALLPEPLSRNSMFTRFLLGKASLGAKELAKAADFFQEAWQETEARHPQDAVHIALYEGYFGFALAEMGEVEAGRTRLQNALASLPEGADDDRAELETLMRRAGLSPKP